jgi:hypothetical protein
LIELALLPFELLLQLDELTLFLKPLHLLLLNKPFQRDLFQASLFHFVDYVQIRERCLLAQHAFGFLFFLCLFDLLRRSFIVFNLIGFVSFVH